MDKTLMMTVNGEPIYKTGSMQMKIRERVFDVRKMRNYTDPQTGIKMFPTPLTFIHWAIAMMNEEFAKQAEGYWDEATEIARLLDIFEY